MTENTAANLSLNSLNSFAYYTELQVCSRFMIPLDWGIGERCLTLLATRVLLFLQVRYDHWFCLETRIGITWALCNENSFECKCQAAG